MQVVEYSSISSCIDSLNPHQLFVLVCLHHPAFGQTLIGVGQQIPILWAVLRDLDGGNRDRQYYKSPRFLAMELPPLTTVSYD